LGQDSGCCKGSNLARPAVLQCACAGIKRRPGRADVVDQYDDLAKETPALTPYGESVFHVAMPLRRRQFGLRRRSAKASERADDRQADVAGEILGLIEAAFTPA